MWLRGDFMPLPRLSFPLCRMGGIWVPGLTQPFLQKLPGVLDLTTRYKCKTSHSLGDRGARLWPPRPPTAAILSLQLFSLSGANGPREAFVDSLPHLPCSAPRTNLNALGGLSTRFNVAHRRSGRGDLQAEPGRTPETRRAGECEECGEWTRGDSLRPTQRCRRKRDRRRLRLD